jgi:hypothetical protein
MTRARRNYYGVCGLFGAPFFVEALVTAINVHAHPTVILVGCLSAFTVFIASVFLLLADH